MKINSRMKMTSENDGGGGFSSKTMFSAHLYSTWSFEAFFGGHTVLIIILMMIMMGMMKI